MLSWGWIDFSQQDQKLTRDILSHLNNPGSVDELGIGVIRDAFSELLFPGTSTIQTIAKYFFLVSYQLKDITDSPQDATVQKLRDMEKACSRAMWDALPESEKHNEQSGIFGNSFFARNSSDWVTRPPSEIYWRGIRILKLFKGPKNLSVPQLLALAANRPDCPTEEGDTASTADSATHHLWHWDLPPENERGDWKKHPTKRLTAAEARFLAEKIADQKESLFAFLVTRRQELGTPEWPNSFAELHDRLAENAWTAQLPELTRKQLNAAYWFSNFMRPAQIRFNVLLGNRQAREDWETQACRQAMPDLAARLTSARPFDLLRLRTTSIARGARHFVQELVDIYAQADVDRLDEALRARERQTKRGREKLPAKGSTPNPMYANNAVGNSVLEFRYTNTRQLLQDLVSGERQEEEHV